MTILKASLINFHVSVLSICFEFPQEIGKREARVGEGEEKIIWAGKDFMYINFFLAFLYCTMLGLKEYPICIEKLH